MTDKYRHDTAESYYTGTTQLIMTYPLKLGQSTTETFDKMREKNRASSVLEKIIGIQPKFYVNAVFLTKYR